MSQPISGPPTWLFKLSDPVSCYRKPVPLRAGCCVYIRSCSSSLFSTKIRFTASWNSTPCHPALHPKAHPDLPKEEKATALPQGNRERERFKEAADAGSVPADAGPLPKQSSLSESWYCLEGRNGWLSPRLTHRIQAFGSGKSRVSEIRTLLYHWIDRLL